MMSSTHMPPTASPLDALAARLSRFRRTGSFMTRPRHTMEAARALVRKADSLQEQSASGCSTSARQAITALDAALNAVCQLEVDLEILSWHLRLAKALYEFGWCSGSVQALEKALAECETCLTNPGLELTPELRATFWRVQGDIYSELGHLRDDAQAFRCAIRAYGAAESEMAPATSPEAWACVQNSIAHCWEELADHAYGVQAIWNALEIYERLALAYTRQCRFALANLTRRKADALRETLNGVV